MVLIHFIIIVGCLHSSLRLLNICSSLSLWVAAHPDMIKQWSFSLWTWRQMERNFQIFDFDFYEAWELVRMCMCAPHVEQRPHAALKWRRQRVDGSRLLNNEPLFFIIMAAKAKSVRAMKRVDRMIKKSEKRIQDFRTQRLVPHSIASSCVFSFPFRSSN